MRILAQGDNSTIEKSTGLKAEEVEYVAKIAKTEVVLENGTAISKLDRPHLIISEFEENPYDYYEREVNN